MKVTRMSVQLREWEKFCQNKIEFISWALNLLS